MKVLIACEESQEVCKAFREKGYEAYSCDIIECSGGHPEWHIKADCLPIINGGICFKTQDKSNHEIPGLWDLIIAHPPCTYLCNTGNRWFLKEYGIHAMSRYLKRVNAISFFLEFVICNAKRIAIENPVGIMSGVYRSPDQIIDPFQFGDPFEKKTCLWLKNLPLLEPTDIVTPPPRQILPSGKTMPKWYSSCGKQDRSSIRSKTFPGIAKAMADQWGGLIDNEC